jgi:antitoxin (DNA-binding transcriptional repressor) of toxin-antitoxin stability system
MDSGTLSHTTMATVTLKEAQASLSELIRQLVPGEELVITENDQPIARLLSSMEKTQSQRR